MSPFQFSLRKLLLGIAFVAVGCAALLNASQWWVGIVWWTTVSLLVTAILLAIYRSQERRAFWLGMAIVGWCYVIVGSDRFPAFTGARQLPQQITTWAYERLPDSRRQQYASQPAPNPPPATYSLSVRTSPPIAYSPTAPTVVSVPNTMVWQPTYTVVAQPGPPPQNPSYIPLGEFVSIGEALWLLLFAYVGGLYARWLYRSEQARSAVPH